MRTVRIWPFLPEIEWDGFFFFLGGPFLNKILKTAAKPSRTVIWILVNWAGQYFKKFSRNFKYRSSGLWNCKIFFGNLFKLYLFATYHRTITSKPSVTFDVTLHQKNGKNGKIFLRQTPSRDFQNFL